MPDLQCSKSRNDALRSGKLHDILLRNRVRKVVEDLIPDPSPCSTLLKGLSIQDGESVVGKKAIQHIVERYCSAGDH